MSKEFDPLAQARQDAVVAEVPALNPDEQRYADWVGEPGDVDAQAAADFAEYLESRPKIGDKKYKEYTDARGVLNGNRLEEVPGKPWAVRVKTDKKGNMLQTDGKGRYQAEKLLQNMESDLKTNCLTLLM